MTIYVLTDSDALRPVFRTVERSRTYTVKWCDLPTRPFELRSRYQAPDSFLYLDAAGMDGAALRRCVLVLEESRPGCFGIVDLEGGVDDIAELFHRGAADYIGSALGDLGVSTARLRRVVEHRLRGMTVSAASAEGEAIDDDSDDAIAYPDACGPDWSGVKVGSEYTFLMLYAGLDRIGDLSRKSSEASMVDLRKRFVAILEEYLGPFGARIWMWKEDDGLMLFPFDGESVDACIGALRLMINRLLIGAEQLAGFQEIGWRLAFHLGRTAYRTNGDTGSIVSADVNFMFHLGSRFLEPGTLSMTQPVHALLADRIRPLTHHRGVFESVHVYQLRDLL